MDDEKQTKGVAFSDSPAQEEKKPGRFRSWGQKKSWPFQEVAHYPLSLLGRVRCGWCWNDGVA